MPLAWAQSPVGDDRWHRNQGTDKMEGMCRDHSQARPRVCRGNGGPLTWGGAGPGRVARTQGAGSNRVKRVCPGKEELQRPGRGGGGGYNDVSNHRVEEGLPFSGGDSEDTIRTEGHRCHEGKSQFWHRRSGLVR